MKKILLVLGLAMTAVSAQATYLYWQLGDTVTMKNTGSTYTLGDEDADPQWYAAKVWAVNGDQKEQLSISQVNENGEYDLTTAVSQIGSAGQYVVNLDGVNSASWSYYVEYIGWDSKGNNGQIGYGSEASYTDLVQQGAIVEYNDTALRPIDQSIVWHGGTANAPEPTSAILMLLGVAGLALKRKQRKVE